MRRVTLAARRAQRHFRRPPRPRWLQPALYGGAAAAVLSVIAASIWWAERVDLVERAETAVVSEVLDWSAGAGLVLREVYVDGRVRTELVTLRDALGLETGRPILGVDLAATKTTLERLPWVEEAIVTRQLPDIVRIQLLEREPLALWQRDRGFALIDRRGRPIDGALTGPGSIATWRHLRVLVGDDAPRHAAHLFALLSTEPEIWARVTAASRIGGRRWSVRLDNGVDVLLPEGDVLAAWRFLAERERAQHLLDRAITVIDLRFLPGRLRLRLDPKVVEGQPA